MTDTTTATHRPEATDAADAARATATLSPEAPADGPTPALSLRNVNFTLGDGDSQVTALDDVSLDVRPGEFLAIVGPSGAGKSSLLAVAGTLSAPTSGKVLINGQDVAALRKGFGGQGRLARFRRQNIGFVFQSGNLIPALTAADQLRLVHRLTGGAGGSGDGRGASRTDGTLDERSDDGRGGDGCGAGRTGGTGDGRGFDPGPLLASVGMEHRSHNRPGALSGGERQRVGIARALVTRPALLLVDEPTAALDRARSREVVELLAAQSRECGVATVMVTHDHDVLDHCDRVLEMVDGRLGEPA